MRKPRDIDAELTALDTKAKLLRERKRMQLGELVITTGAGALPIERLAGALLAAVDERDTATKEVWRLRGLAFFQRKSRGTASNAAIEPGSSTAGNGDARAAAADGGAA